MTYSKAKNQYSLLQYIKDGKQWLVLVPAKKQNPQKLFLFN